MAYKVYVQRCGIGIQKGDVGFVEMYKGVVNVKILVVFKGDKLQQAGVEVKVYICIYFIVEGFVVVGFKINRVIIGIKLLGKL